MTRHSKPATRVQKGRTAKQQAASKTFSRFQTVTTAEDANPKDSWWVGLGRQELQAAAKDEQHRIAYSRCGRVNDPKYSHI